MTRRSRAALWSYLAAKTGITEAWRARVLPTGNVQVEDVAFGVTAWALAVEYVHDLRRAPLERLRRTADPEVRVRWAQPTAR